MRKLFVFLIVSLPFSAVAQSTHLEAIEKLEGFNNLSLQEQEKEMAEWKIENEKRIEKDKREYKERQEKIDKMSQEELSEYLNKESAEKIKKDEEMQKANEGFNNLSPAEQQKYWDESNKAAINSINAGPGTEEDKARMRIDYEKMRKDLEDMKNDPEMQQYR